MPYQFRINQLRFNDGSSIEPSHLTVLIGPNNVGKSCILKEIAARMTGSLAPPILVKDMQVELPKQLGDLTDTPHTFSLEPAEQNYVRHDFSPDLCSSQKKLFKGPFPAGFDYLFNTTPESKEKDFFRWFGASLVAHLTTERRLQLSKRCATNNEYAQSLLELLVFDETSRESVEDTFREVFREEIVLDYSGLSHVAFRVLPEKRELPKHPGDLKEALNGVPFLDDQGDGMRSYVGITAAIEAVRRPLVLIDEPETFLHPPQSRAIGRLVANAQLQNRQVFIATHSVDVLRGVLSAEKSVSIIRVTRKGTTNRFDVLDSKFLSEVAADPLKSSARVLNGLFHRSVAVVEGESDERLLAAIASQVGGDRIHFVSAGGKQATNGIIQMYKQLHVRCASVLDFDVLRDESELSACLKSHDITDIDAATKVHQELKAVASGPSEVEHRAKQLRSRLSTLLSKMDALNPSEALSVVRAERSWINKVTDPWSNLKHRGLGALEGELQDRVKHLLDELRATGIFINPKGELESLLPEEVSPLGDKQEWVRRAIPLVYRLKANPNSLPWSWIRQLVEYLERP